MEQKYMFSKVANIIINILKMSYEMDTLAYEVKKKKRK